MKLKELKKRKDEYCTKLVLKQIDFIKKYFKIKPNKRVYYLFCWCGGREYFLCGNTVYIANFEPNETKDINISSIYTVDLSREIEVKTVIPDDTTPKIKEFYGAKIDYTKHIYTKEDFLNWYNSPCEVIQFSDITYAEAVKFLQNYKKTTFKTDRYLFYVKRDDDLTWTFFIYAKDLKTKSDLKIYFNDHYYYSEADFPENPRDVFIEDLSGKLSDFQKRECKKAFMDFCREECKELRTKNYYALEFLKQCIQPVEYDRGWAVARPYSLNQEFKNIWIDDVLVYDEKPYFLSTDGDRGMIDSTKIAAFDFFKPEYKSTGIYVSGSVKRNHWNVDFETLKRLTEFLKKPYDYTKTIMYQKRGIIYNEDKTNWQVLIDLYNDNTGYNYDQEIPLDLPVPDYTKLAK